VGSSFAAYFAEATKAKKATADKDGGRFFNRKERKERIEWRI
jgi:hypothetical protein